MALKYRGRNVYCYRSERRGGRVAFEYLGSGAEALAAEAELVRERAERWATRQANAWLIAKLRRLERATGRFHEAVKGLHREAMEHLGWYLHRRQWRRRGGAMVPGTKAFDDALKAERARRLFASADDPSAVIERLGGRLGARIRERLIGKLSTDPFVREAIRREADMLRRELEGEAPTVVERLAAERVVVGWLGVAWADTLCAAFADDLENRDVASLVARMRNAANRHYLASLKALALIRRATAGAPT